MSEFDSKEPTEAIRSLELLLTRIAPIADDARARLSRCDQIQSKVTAKLGDVLKQLAASDAEITSKPIESFTTDDLVYICNRSGSALSREALQKQNTTGADIALCQSGSDVQATLGLEDDDYLEVLQFYTAVKMATTLSRLPAPSSLAGKHPLDWNSSQLAEWIKSVPSYTEHASKITDHQINGAMLAEIEVRIGSKLLGMDGKQLLALKAEFAKLASRTPREPSAAAEVLLLPMRAECE